MDEREMATLVREVGDVLAPDVRALVAGGAARGRARRRRQRIGAGAAGFAAVAGVVGGLGWALAPGSGADAVRDGAVAADPPAATATPAPHASARRFGMDPGKTGWVLGSLLTGDVTHRRAWYDDPERPHGFQAGSVRLDGSLVSVVLEHVTLPGCGEQPPGAACDPIDGGFLSTSTYEEPASGGGPTGVVASSATYFTDDGFAVTATAWNAPAEKGAAPTRAAPVLTEQRLAEVVVDPVWLEDPQ